MISVIIPVYNVEKYLDECIRSVVNQSYTDFECILIDDGSTDRSGEICDNWAIADSRIKVVHQENQGVSVARNKGIELSQGEYIVFIDSDDWVETNYLSDLMSDESADLVVSGDYVDRGEVCLGANIPLADKQFDFAPEAIDDIHHLLKSHLIFGPVFKRYKSAIIKNNNIKYNSLFDYGEDLLFVFEYLKYTETISTTTKVSYHYRLHSNDTLSRKYRPDFFEINYYQYGIIRELLIQKKVYRDNVQEYLYTRLWGIIYDSVFQYRAVDFKDLYRHNRMILSMLEIKDRLFQKADFGCAGWLKFLVIRRLPLLLTIVLRIKR